jgi:hypothetical protein
MMARDAVTGRVIVERKNIIRREVNRRWSMRGERTQADQDRTFAIGLDLAQVRDYSALAIVERVRTPATDHSTGASEYHVRYLSRFELGTPYTEIVEETSELLNSRELRGYTRLVLDRTGVGAPVADMFLHAGLHPFPICFTGGNRETTKGRTFCVPRNYFVSVLQILLQAGRLKISNALPVAPVLEQELLRFSLRHRAADEDLSEGWRENDHDDLVFAVAMACYYFERRAPRNKAISVRASMMAM